MARIIYVDEQGRRVRPPRERPGGRTSRSRDDSAGNIAAAAIAFFLVGAFAVSQHGHFPGTGGSASAGTSSAAAGVRAPSVAGILGNPGPVAHGHRAGQPWSVFSDGGGPRAAVAWSKDLLRVAGVPVSAANVRFVYDWQVSEGGGGLYNPLNQGPVPGRPDLTSTGQQYGGGAADYVSWRAGLEGAALYLHMPNYTAVLAALRRSDYNAAVSALERSYWAGSHYGYGANWHAGAVPGT